VSVDGGLSHEGVDLKAKYLMPLAQCAGLNGALTSTQDILDTAEEMIDAAMARHVESYTEEGGANLSLRPAAETQPPSPEDTTMSDAAALTAANAKITALETELATLKQTIATQATEITTMSTKAKRLESVEPAVSETIVLLKATPHFKDSETLAQNVKRVLDENAQLLTATRERDESDVLRDVDQAIACHGPSGTGRVPNIETMKEDLIELRRTSPKVFRKQYEPLTADQIRLSRRAPVTPPAPNRPPAKKPGEKVMMSHSALTSWLMREEKLGYGDATEKAARLIQEDNIPEQAK
jgi:hypothetical protein